MDPPSSHDPDAPEATAPAIESAEPEAPAEPEAAPAPTDEPPAAEAAAATATRTAPEAAAEGPTTGGALAEDPASEEGSDGDDTSAEEPRARSHGFRIYRRLASLPYGVPLNYEPQERQLFTDTEAPLGASVCYVVRAVGSTGPLVESAASNEVCLDVRDISPPAPPTGLAVVPRDGGLEVVWSPSSESDLGGYRIYRAVGDAEPTRVGEVPAGTTAWLDQTPRSGVLYRYKVTAFDLVGNEGLPSGAAQGRAL